MKLTVLYVLALRCLANGMRTVENKLYYSGCNVRRNMDKKADAAFAKAQQLRLHAQYLDTDCRKEKIKAVADACHRIMDCRVQSAQKDADRHDKLGNQLVDIVSGCK